MGRINGKSGQKIYFLTRSGLITGSKKLYGMRFRGSNKLVETPSCLPPVFGWDDGGSFFGPGNDWASYNSIFIRESIPIESFSEPVQMLLK